MLPPKVSQASSRILVILSSTGLDTGLKPKGWECRKCSLTYDEVSTFQLGFACLLGWYEPPTLCNLRDRLFSSPSSFCAALCVIQLQDNGNKISQTIGLLFLHEIFQNNMTQHSRSLRSVRHLWLKETLQALYFFLVNNRTAAPFHFISFQYWPCYSRNRTIEWCLHYNPKLIVVHNKIP